MKKLLLSTVLLIASINLLSQNEWGTYTIPNSEYTIQMPFSPIEGVKSIMVNGTNVDMHYLNCESDTISYFMFYSNFLPNTFDLIDIDVFYKKAIDTIRKRFNGKEVFLKNDSINGHRGIYGRFIIKKEKKYHLLVKEFLIGNRLYQLLVYADNKHKNSPSIDKFYNSFSITNNVIKDNISNLLDQMGFNYEKDEDNQIYLTISFTDERTQLVYISPSILNYDGKFYYDIWSPVYDYSELLSDSITQNMLEQNGDNEVGSFQSLKIDEGFLLVYSAKFPENMDTTSLQKAMYFITEIADNMEIKLNSEDKY